MVIIFSINCDSSTSFVIDWVDSFNTKYLRINETEFFGRNNSSTIELDNHNNSIKLNNTYVIPNKKVNLWIRKIVISYIRDTIKVHDSKITHIVPDVIRHINKESNVFINSIYQFLETKFTLGSHQVDRISKLKMLKYAKKSNLNIPNTIITNNKKVLINWSKNHKEIIVKSLGDGFFFKLKKESFGLYSEKIDTNTLNNLPTNFLPCICQEFIDKQYDIRVFYLQRKCYSMVIFSQLDQQTSTDFRKYNLAKPTRKVPFKLPKSIEYKICDLMISLELNMGSIDMIRDKKGEYFFLEVNPSGQFGFLSQSCNYYIEEKIAKILSYE